MTRSDGPFYNNQNWQKKPSNPAEDTEDIQMSHPQHNPPQQHADGADEGYVRNDLASQPHAGQQTPQQHYPNSQAPYPHLARPGDTPNPQVDPHSGYQQQFYQPHPEQLAEPTHQSASYNNPATLADQQQYREDTGYPVADNPHADYNNNSGYDTHSNYDVSPQQANFGPENGPASAPVGYDNTYDRQQFEPASHDHQSNQNWAGSNAAHADNFQQSYEQSPASYEHPAQQDDYRAYDLTNYKPAEQTGQHFSGDPNYAPVENWDQGSQAPPHDAYAPPRHPSFNLNTGHAHGGAVAPHDDVYKNEDEDDDYEDYEEESTGSRKFMIAAAILVSMIIVGGGFFYGYGILFSKPSNKTEMPIISANQDPSKIEPHTPGGRKLENTDSQLMNRLGSRGQADNINTDIENRDRVRRVPTIIVGRDGRLIVQKQSSDATSNQTDASNQRTTASQSSQSFPGQNASSSGIPGMIIDGVQPQQRTADKPSQPQPSQPFVSVPPASTPQVNKAAALPKVISSQVQDPVTRSTPRRRSKYPPLPELSGLNKPGVDLGPETPIPGTTPPSDFDPMSPQAGVGQVPRSNAALVTGSSNNYVAVLSTKRSRIDALTSFADLQQRYPGVLGTKVPDVRRADLTARGLGVMYRAVVGPPGSREIASQLCTRLKTAGYDNCWIAPY